MILLKINSSWLSPIYESSVLSNTLKLHVESEFKFILLFVEPNPFLPYTVSCNDSVLVIVGCAILIGIIWAIQSPLLNFIIILLIFVIITINSPV
jgi:hypothetical protein